MSSLTEKQQRFADEYIISANASDAYRKAGYKCTTDNAVYASSSKLLSNPKVESYIQEKMEMLQSEKIASQEEVLEYLTTVMRRQEQENVVVTLRTKEEKWTEVSGQLKKQSVEKEEAAIVPIPTKVSDSNKAAELLGKRYGIFTDKMDLAVEGPIIISGIDELED